ncbi:ABC transporter permease subunit [Massilicoli timonensis]|uniref:ABC transporter permease subunit n=1 Tax=Massilicoli timonensis TaxID=2015901 RepID=UPI00307A151A
MRNRSYHSIRVLIIVFLLISVVAPLITLLCNIHVGDIPKIIDAPQFWPMIFNSLLASALATAISVTLALALAWCVNRSSIKMKGLFSVLFTLPMLIPSISHGMGLVLLFGDNGLLTNLFGVNLPLYGLLGVVIGEVLYSFPVAFLLFTDTFQYEDYTIYEAAEVLGLSKFNQFDCITLANMKRPLLSAIFAVFTLVFTDYGVPLVLGGKMMTIPVYMYREVIGLLDFSKGAIIGILLLIPAVIAFIADLRNKDGQRSSTIVRAYEIHPNKVRDGLSYLLCIVTVVLISLPILTFVYLSVVKQYPIDLSFSLVNVAKAFDLGLGMYLINSLTIALFSALIGVLLTYFAAYITARSKRTFTTMALHLISILSLAIPGIVLGLSYVLFFKGSVIYGTLAILVQVNLVHFFASPYLLAYNSFSNFNENLEDVSMTLGICRMRMLSDVYMPCMKETLCEMFSYIFVNAMVTISAVSFLANFKTMPLSLLIPQFDSQSLIEATAFISVVILAVNVLMKIAVFFVKHRIKRYE